MTAFADLQRLQTAAWAPFDTALAALVATSCSPVAHTEQACVCLQVLHMILGLERLDRIMLFMEEIATMPTARLSELRVSCCAESAHNLVNSLAAHSACQAAE